MAKRRNYKTKGRAGLSSRSAFFQPSLPQTGFITWPAIFPQPRAAVPQSQIRAKGHQADLRVRPRSKIPNPPKLTSPKVAGSGTDDPTSL